MVGQSSRLSISLLPAETVIPVANNWWKRCRRRCCWDPLTTFRMRKAKFAYTLVMSVAFFCFFFLLPQTYVVPVEPRLSAGSYQYTPMKPQVPSQGVPWPLPKMIKFGETDLIFDPTSFQITTNSTCKIILDAIQRYKEILIKESGGKNETENKNGQIQSLIVTIQQQGDCDRYPYLGMNENYVLSVKENEPARLKAPEIWGALRGLETFSQLTFLESDGQQGYTLKIHTAQIEDQPRFSHRGVLLDTSRHFLSINTLKKNLDLMAFAKFNVFHWHIVDDQSFPYDSAVNVDMSRRGAYTARHVYSKEDVSTIVDYARQRGIRVIPEFDTPGHTLAWGRGQPDLLAQCRSSGALLPFDAYGVIDPSNPNTFDFLSKLFTEISQRFPDSYVHLGGDEVYFDCWRSNKRVQELMRKLKISQHQDHKLEEYYMQQLVNLVKQASGQKASSSYIVWQEVFDNGVRLDKNAIIHVWKGNTPEWGRELFKATKRKLRAILSSCWYLNYIKYGENWEEYYQCDPHHFAGTKREKSLVIGGEACMWGEYIDATNVLSTLWPRASVVAERLWSPADVKDVTMARARLQEHRCRLVRRGYPASPVTGPGFCQIEWD